MNGKGDKRRPGKPGAYEDNYDVINWGQDKNNPPKKTVTELVKESTQEVTATAVSGRYISLGKS